MADFLPKSQVQPGGVTPQRVQNLADDLSNLFGTVEKASAKFAQVGETAAKLDFNDRSAEITNQILEFEKLAPDNMDNPDFWEGYTASIDNSLKELVQHSENYKGNQASYDMYKGYASDFAASIGMKYFPRNNGNQLNATNKRIINQFDDIVSKLGRDVTAKNMESFDSMLSTVIKDPNERKEAIRKSVYGSMFSAWDSGFDSLAPQVRQDYVTADDGSFNINGAAQLYNSLSANELSQAIVENGKIRIVSASGNVLDDEEAAKRLNMIYGMYRKPEQNNVINFAFEAMQNAVDSAKPDYKLSSDNVNAQFTQQQRHIAEFKGTKWFNVLTDSEQKALFNMEDKLLQDKAAYNALMGYVSSGKVATFEGASALTFDYVNALGKTVKNAVIPTELISQWKSHLGAEASQKLFDSSIPIDEATKAMQIVVDKTGSLPSGVAALKTKVDVGSPVSSLSEATNRLRTMEALVKSGHYPTIYMDVVNRGYGLLAKAQKDPKQEAVILTTLNQELSNQASGAKAKELSASNAILSIMQKRTKRVGFDLKVGMGTSQQFANLAIDMGTNYNAMSEDDKAEFIENNTYETASGLGSRTGWSKSFVVIKPKLKNGTVIEEQVMIDGLNGWVKAYNMKNPKKPTTYDMDDFQFDSAPNGTISVKNKDGSVVLNGNVTAERLLEFRSYLLKTGSNKKQTKKPTLSIGGYTIWE